jgi:hypothetical protein
MHGFESTVPVTLDMMIPAGARRDARLQTRAGRGRPDMLFAVEDNVSAASSMK